MLGIHSNTPVSLRYDVKPFEGPPAHTFGFLHCIFFSCAPYLAARLPYYLGHSRLTDHVPLRDYCGAAIAWYDDVAAEAAGAAAASMLCSDLRAFVQHALHSLCFWSLAIKMKSGRGNRN